MNNLEFIANVSEVKIMKMHKNIRVTLEIPAGTCSSLLAGQLQAHGYDETHFNVSLVPMGEKDIKEAQDDSRMNIDNCIEVIEEGRKREVEEDITKEEENKKKPESTDISRKWSDHIIRWSRLKGIPIKRIHDGFKKKYGYGSFRDLDEELQEKLISYLEEKIDDIEIPDSPNNP